MESSRIELTERSRSEQDGAEVSTQKKQNKFPLHTIKYYTLIPKNNISGG
jgi:hypothetical protein